MKKNNKNKFLKLIFMMLFISFSIIYVSGLTGYYEYQNYKKAALTNEQIKKFEEDIQNGIEVDITEYLVKEDLNYQNRLSILASKLSDSISNIVEHGVQKTFKFLSKIIIE